MHGLEIPMEIWEMILWHLRPHEKINFIICNKILFGTFFDHHIKKVFEKIPSLMEEQEFGHSLLFFLKFFFGRKHQKNLYLNKFYNYILKTKVYNIEANFQYLLMYQQCIVIKNLWEHRPNIKFTRLLVHKLKRNKDFASMNRNIILKATKWGIQKQIELYQKIHIRQLLFFSNIFCFYNPKLSLHYSDLELLKEIYGMEITLAIEHLFLYGSTKNQKPIRKLLSLCQNPKTYKNLCTTSPYQSKQFVYNKVLMKHSNN